MDAEGSRASYDVGLLTPRVEFHLVHRGGYLRVRDELAEVLEGVVADADGSDGAAAMCALERDPRDATTMRVFRVVRGELVDAGPVDEGEVQGSVARVEVESAEYAVQGGVGVAHVSGGELAGEEHAWARGVVSRESGECARDVLLVAIARRGVDVGVAGDDGVGDDATRVLTTDAERAEGEAGHMHPGRDLHLEVGHHRFPGGDARKDSRSCVSAA